MKILNLKFLVIAFIASLTLMTSCKKDKDNEPEVSTDNIVGIWSVDQGTALVYAAGELLADLNITTGGTLEFNEDGTGNADFSITLMGDTETATGPFTWERDGFELIVDNGGAVERWALVDDEKNLKTIQYSHEDEEDDMEVEFTLTLNKK
ncbi:MAG: hypothetical protein AAFZ15_06730 [Bacteroidota bacterium]